jgi:putative glutamine amidotransferase
MRPRIAITLEVSAKGERLTHFLNQAYAQAIEEAGGKALYFPPFSSPGMMAETLSMIDGLVLTGGADIHPSYYGEEIVAPVFLSPTQRTDFDLEFFRAALQAGKAILAICHGMQIVNVALGGTLFQDIPSQIPRAIEHRGKDGRGAIRHPVRIKKESRLTEILGGRFEIEVPSIHHQAVKGLGTDLRVSAEAPDGLVEGVELPGNPRFIGVQWHPEEELESEPTRRLFRTLIEMASMAHRL